LKYESEFSPFFVVLLYVDFLHLEETSPKLFSLSFEFGNEVHFSRVLTIV